MYCLVLILSYPLPSYQLHVRYYSSKYSYPTLSLGPRFEFETVSATEKYAGNRPLMFNFIGSLGTGEFRKDDRLALQAVIETTDWKVQICVCMCVERFSLRGGTEMTHNLRSINLLIM